MKRINIGVLVLLGVAAGGIGLSAAQSGSSIDTVRVLQELVSEVRQLRIAVEQSSQLQAQAQLLGSQLTLQQRRVSEIAARVDAARRELDGLIARSSGIVSELANLENSLTRLNDPQKRREVEGLQQHLKQQFEGLTGEEQRARNREAVFTQDLAVEEARLNELIARVEQSFRR